MDLCSFLDIFLEYCSSLIYHHVETVGMGQITTKTCKFLNNEISYQISVSQLPTSKLPSSQLQREGYHETRIFCNNVGCVLAQTICFIFCKHEVQSNLYI